VTTKQDLFSSSKHDLFNLSNMIFTRLEQSEALAEKSDMGKGRNTAGEIEARTLLPQN